MGTVLRAIFWNFQIKCVFVWYQHISINTVGEGQSKVHILFIVLKYNQLKSISAKGCRNILDVIHILVILSPIV